MAENNSLRIIHVSSPLSWRGGEQQLHYLYTNLKSDGHQQVVFCPFGSELSKRTDSQETVTYKKRGGVDPLAARALKKLASEFRPDVIHAHDAHAHTTCVLSSALFGLKIPVVLSRRVDFHVGQSGFSRFKYNHGCIKAIVCVSNAIEEIVRIDLGKNPNQIRTTIHSGVDLNRFKNPIRGKLRSELTIEERVKLIGNVAALADHKDYPTFLKTAAHFRNDDSVRFVIIGTGPMEAEIKTMVDEMNLGERVIFTGFRTDLNEIFSDLDIFLFPSKTEGLGTSVLDALGFRVPVVATRAGGIPEIIDDEYNGLLANVGDHALLASQIKRLLDDSELAEKLIRNGLETLKQFSHRTTADKTVEVYRRIAEVQ